MHVHAVPPMSTAAEAFRTMVLRELRGTSDEELDEYGQSPVWQAYQNLIETFERLPTPEQQPCGFEDISEGGAERAHQIFVARGWKFCSECGAPITSKAL